MMFFIFNAVKLNSAMARNFKIQGKEQNLTEGPLISEFNHIVKTYKIETVRSKADIIDVATEPHDIIGLEFEDGGEWIGPAEDIEKIFGEHIQLSRDGNELFPMSIRSSGGSDRGIQSVTLFFYPL